jgi:Tfp pilus assembly protein PilF
MAADSEDIDAVAVAAFDRGLLLWQQGDDKGAREAYQRAIDSGHPDAAPKAEVGLGVLLGDQGDLAGAQAAYQRAIDSGHADAAQWATVHFGVLLKEQGDLAGARQAYQRAIDSGHADAALIATVNLGNLLKEQGDLAGAREAYERAIDSGHPDAMPRGEVGLGLLLEEQGDLAGAREAYQRAIDSGHPDAAAVAAYNLGNLLRERGDLAEARNAVSDLSGEVIRGAEIISTLCSFLGDQFRQRPEKGTVGRRYSITLPNIPPPPGRQLFDPYLPKGWEPAATEIYVPSDCPGEPLADPVILYSRKEGISWARRMLTAAATALYREGHLDGRPVHVYLIDSGEPDGVRRWMTITAEEYQL